jgi:methylthioribose-1-phosphate isomerase
MKCVPGEITPDRVKVCNLTFDVTPTKNITAIISEEGIIKQPMR